jgi:hypothetical protein
MGNRTVSEFVRSCDNQYLANKLSRIPTEVDDLSHLHDVMLKIVITKRKALEVNTEEARDYYDRIKHSGLDELIDEHDLLAFCFGDEWWYSIPKKPNPDYEYLCRIITTVKEALKVNMKTVAEYTELKIPSYALSYLVNADASGLDDKDIAATDNYMLQYYKEAVKAGGHVIFSPSDQEPYFAHSPEYGLPCDVVDCTVLIVIS